MLINILFAWVVHDGGHDEDSADLEKHATTTVDTKTSQAVGYVQGMSFIAMNLLWHAGKEEAAFWVFAAMMQRYDLRQMFEPPDMRGLQMRTFTIAQLLQYTMPELSKHLAEYLHNSMGLVLTDWLLTLFSSSMALGPLAELWDRFFVDGYRCIYCLILARLRCLQPWLLREKDFTRLTHLIHFAHVNFDRVDGNLVPRLPGKPPSGEGCSAKPGGSSSEAAVLGAGGISSSRLTVLQRFVAGAATALGAAATLGGTAPRGHSRNGDSEEELPGIRKRQAAWTCQECNGSEDCESWLALVTELADAETVPAGVIEGLEQIFDGSEPPPSLPRRPSWSGPPELQSPSSSSMAPTGKEVTQQASQSPFSTPEERIREPSPAPDPGETSPNSNANDGIVNGGGDAGGSGCESTACCRCEELEREVLHLRQELAKVRKELEDVRGTSQELRTESGLLGVYIGSA
jgi:hypothetical protein